MYHLPLLPGYGPNTNVRSSAPTQSNGADFSEAEEEDYQGTYFTSYETRSPTHDGYISSSPVTTRNFPPIPASPGGEVVSRRIPIRTKPVSTEEDVAEVVFFEYGVVVFFGLEEAQEKSIIEDIEKADIMKRKIDENDWEVEECHFAVSIRS
jgi:uncharacterized Rmd1/YagE family protein